MFSIGEKNSLFEMLTEIHETALANCVPICWEFCSLCGKQYIQLNHEVYCENCLKKILGEKK